MTRKVYNVKGAEPVGPYSHAVEAGGMLYCSGQIPLDATTGKIVAGDITMQTEQSFKNCQQVLETAGLTFDDVIKVTVFLTDMANFSAMNAVYEKQFVQPYPSRSAIAVKALPLGAEVEIEMIAKMK